MLVLRSSNDEQNWTDRFIVATVQSNKDKCVLSFSYVWAKLLKSIVIFIVPNGLAAATTQLKGYQKVLQRGPNGMKNIGINTYSFKPQKNII